MQLVGIRSEVTIIQWLLGAQLLYTLGRKEHDNYLVYVSLVPCVHAIAPKFYTFQLCHFRFCFVLFNGTVKQRASIIWSQNCPIQLSGFHGMLLLCIGVINKYLGNVWPLEQWVKWIKPVRSSTWLFSMVTHFVHLCSENSKKKAAGWRQSKPFGCRNEW